MKLGLEELVLQESALRDCACGKRSHADKQKCLSVKMNSLSYFDREVETLDANMECQVCGDCHLFRLILKERGRD